MLASFWKELKDEFFLCQIKPILFLHILICALEDLISKSTKYEYKTKRKFENQTEHNKNSRITDLYEKKKKKKSMNRELNM